MTSQVICLNLVRFLQQIMESLIILLPAGVGGGGDVRVRHDGQRMSESVAVYGPLWSEITPSV